MATADLGKVTGDSAYQSWLAQGHTGTIDDFLSRQVWPTMSASVAGVAKLGTGLSITDGVLRVTNAVPIIDDDVDWDTVAAALRQHLYPEGTIITSTWKDTVAGVTYDFPWRVMYNTTEVDEDGVSHTGSWLCAQYAPNRSIQFDASGRNYWSESDLHLWLNSDGAAGEWWEAQYEGDTEPSWAAGMPGWMYELPQDMLDVIVPVAVTTTESGRSTVTLYDKFIVPAASQYYMTTDITMGAAWPYVTSVCAAAGYSTPTANNVPGRTEYSIEAKNTGRQCWLRSYLYLNYENCLNSSGGYRNDNDVTFSYYPLPACFIG